MHEGKALVRHVVDILSLPGVQDVIVVVPPSRDAYNELLAGSGARTVVNDAPEAGMSRSLHVGLNAVTNETQAVLVALADQPTIDRGVVDAILRAWRAGDTPIVAPSYRGERGHPVLLSAEIFPELRQVVGDRGARDVIERDPRRVKLVPVDAEMPRDVDTPADLAALARSRSKP